MSNLTDEQASSTKRVMVFGPPKTGKSTLAGELAEHFNLIWFDLENGHDVLFKMPVEWQERVQLIKLKDTSSYPIAIETVLKVLKGPVSICRQHGKCSCMLCIRAEKQTPTTHDVLFNDVDLNNLPLDTIVVFDSDTQLTSSAIANITKAEADDYKMQRDDWGALSKLMDVVHSHIQNANYNIVMISHEIVVEEESKKEARVPVAGSRNFSRNVAKCFSDVVYCEMKAKRHMFGSSTSYSTNIMTGSRGDVCLENMTKPSLLAIFKPELYPEGTATSITVNKTKTATGGKTQANSVLARLRERNGK